MKRIYIYLLALISVIGCTEINNYTPDTNSDLTTYTAPFTLNLSEAGTKSFDENLKWHWESDDTIFGYQNSGSRIINSLIHIKDNTFGVSDFTYTDQNASTFHFVYAGEAKLNDNGNNRDIDQNPIQSGEWSPTLVGSHTNCTFDEMVQKNESLKLSYLSSAFEVRAWKPDVDMEYPDDEDKINLSKAILYSDVLHFLVHAVPSINYSTGAITYTQKSEEDFNETGESVTVENIDSHSVVFNVAPHPEKYSKESLKLILLDENGDSLKCILPPLNFIAGKKTVLNITWEDSENLPAGTLPNGKEFNEKVNAFLGNNTGITKILFVTNSSKKSETPLTDDIYMIKNQNTLEIHTENGEFIANEDCKYMFYGFDDNDEPNKLVNIKSIDLGSNFNTSNVTAMDWMFCQLDNLTDLNLGQSFDTQNVTSMTSMFWGSQSITSLNLGNKFNTKNVKTMFGVFGFCSSLTNLDLGDHFYTQNATDMEMMFSFCSSLTSLDLGEHFDTKNVTDMSLMFNSCESLANLDLGDHFYTNKVTDMEGMFALCYKLESLNLTTFTFNSNVAIEGIFDGVGRDAVNKPIPIYVTSEGKDFIETSGNSEIDSQYAKLVIPNNGGLGFDGPDGDLNGDEEWF